jgi:hypothetical protein
VHNTWQGLYPHDIAPESGQLLAATGPVASVARSVGEDFTTAGTALSSYAEEVTALQEQMEAIRAQAVAFVAEVADNEDWTSDAGLFDRHAALGLAVADTLAAWDAAQARCVSALNALHGAAPVQVDNGDGVLGPGELGYTAEQYQAAAAAGQAPWGTPEVFDRPWYEDVAAYAVGLKDSGVEAAKGLAALGGYDATTGGFSWDTAGTAWQGLGTFALAGAVYAVPGGHALDQSG